MSITPGYQSQRKKNLALGRTLDQTLEEQLDCRMRTGQFKDSGWSSVSELVSLDMVTFDTSLGRYVVTESGERYWRDFLEMLPQKVRKKVGNSRQLSDSVMQ